MVTNANPTVMSVEEYLESVVLESIGFKGPLAAFYEGVGVPEGREHV